MKRFDKSVVVEVKRSGRSIPLKLGSTLSELSEDAVTSDADRPAASLFADPDWAQDPGLGASETRPSAARQAADLMFSTPASSAQSAGSVSPAAATVSALVPGGRVLPSLVDLPPPDPAALILAQLADVPLERRRGRPPGSRNVPKADRQVSASDEVELPLDAAPKRGRGRPRRNPAVQVLGPGAEGVAVDPAIAAQALDTLNRLTQKSEGRLPVPPVDLDLVDQRRTAATPLVLVPKRRGRPPNPFKKVAPIGFAEREWTSSKALDEPLETHSHVWDGQDDAKPRLDDLANEAHRNQVADEAPQVGANGLALPAQTLLPLQLVRPITDVMQGREASSSKGVASDRLTYRARVSTFRPGERWKRRLRGFARK